jgi:hypothetical protein
MTVAIGPYSLPRFGLISAEACRQNVQHDLACLDVGGDHLRVESRWHGMDETLAELGYAPCRANIRGVFRPARHPEKHKHGADKADKLNFGCLIGACTHPVRLRSLPSFGGLSAPVFGRHVFRTQMHLRHLTTRKALMP